MEFRILGPLEVLDDERPIDVGGQKHRALLAMLVLHANEIVSVDRLIDALWDEQPPDTARNALQVYVSQLRKVLGKDRLQTKAPGYLLRLAEGELDLDRFQRLVVEREHRSALSLWRGRTLAEFAYERFAQPEIARLEELRLACLEERIEVDLVRGRHAELVGELEALVRDHPLRERLRAQLMLALYRSRRQAEALETYREARTVLVEELGIEPGHELRELEKAILNQDPSLGFVSTNQEAAEVAEASRGDFVGREREMEELLAGLVDASAGHGRLFLLVGEPGIGKSRLADELILRARARGARVLIGRCWEAGGAPAYWPWVQSLRVYVREAKPDALRVQLGAGATELAQILPELREILSGLPEPASPDSEGARFRLFDATAQFLRNASESKPIVVVLDDLHAADTPSLLLLQFLARELGSTHVLLLAGLRDVDPVPGQPLTAMLTEVAREPVTRRLSLGGLSEQDVAEYVELTASEIASPELVAALHDETEGNPLFVGETVRLLALEGLRPKSTGARIEIPQSVRDVIARRLTHLSEKCNRVLVLASVLGREFALAALARLGGVSEDELLETLDEAMAARIVSDVPSGPGRLGFAHVLIRDTLYEGLTTARRVRLHRQAVGALEALHRNQSGPHLAELAHHTIAGREYAKGLDYARRAGDRSATLLAYEEAARLYALGLETLDSHLDGDEVVRCELLLRLGDVQARAGEIPSAKETFLRAAEIARRARMPDQLARAALGYGGRFVWSRAWGDRNLVPLLEEALTALSEGDSDLRVRLLSRLAGGPLRDMLPPKPREAMSQQALEMARRLGDAATLGYALDGRHCANMGPEVLELRLEIATELIEVSETVGERERAYGGHDYRFHALLEAGELAAAHQEYEALGHLGQELRQPAQLWYAAVNGAKLALFEGRFSDAEKAIQEAVELGRSAQSANAQMAFDLQTYALRREQGRLGEVIDVVERAVDLYPAYPVWRYVLMDVFAELGRKGDARDAFNVLAADRFPLYLEMQWLFSISVAAEVCGYLGDVERAPTLYELLRPYALHNATLPPELCRGSVSRELGILTATMSRCDDAVQHFDDALEMNAKMGAHPWLARTQYDYARLLLARDQPGERERAHELLAAATTLADQIGMNGLAGKVVQLGQSEP
jgi:DNA-binding SARP family transcriptional activator/tetratricopeptide (TPR) repeat protein